MLCFAFGTRTYITSSFIKMCSGKYSKLNRAKKLSNLCDIEFFMAIKFQGLIF